MKIITQNGIAKYAFADNDWLDITGNNIVAPNFIIGDLSTINSVLYTSVDNMPEDFRGEKYLYDGVSFTANPDYTEV